MKALEFQAHLSSDNKLPVPPEVAARIPKEQAVQVIVLWPELSDSSGSDDTDWDAIKRDQFLKGYSEGDSIYDSL